MRFSLIVPMYNESTIIRDTVRTLSAYLQARVGEYELIFVDDGSTDESAEILLRAAAEDPRLRVIRQSNRGLSAARNAALSAARGQWLMFLDSDDWVSPGP